MSETTTEKTAAEETQPNQLERGPDGLIKSVEYVRNPDGTINWRKMIKPEFLAIKKENFIKRNEPVPESIVGLEDKDLLILLGGVKDLARLRGYTELRHNPIVSSPQYVAVVTTIVWIPNFETGGHEVRFDEMADAHEHNTKGFMRCYLSTCAANRGFVRAVRNFLGINIVGQDEVGADVVEDAPTNSNGDPRAFLRGLLDRNKIAFESFKNRMIKENIAGASDWNSLQDVPQERVFELADIVTLRLEAAKQAKAAQAK